MKKINTGITLIIINLLIGLALLFVCMLPKSSVSKNSATSHDMNTMVSMPGMDGNKTKRYTIDYDLSNPLLPNQEVTLNFRVYDAASGNKAVVFKKLYGKLVHLIIVNNDLTYFNHIHPEQTPDGFTIKTTFPQNGGYHLYADFQPLEAIEQQIGTSLLVGNSPPAEPAKIGVDTNLTKIFGEYEVSLSYPTPLQADQLSMGQQKLTFTLKNAKTKEPITNLKPYLEAYGHLVMINQQSFEYLHVHPADRRVPAEGASGGPLVEFLPFGISAPIKPGVYRVFGQFNPDNKLFTADFTIQIE